MLAFSSNLFAEDLVSESYAVAVQTDVVYGRGRVGATGPKPHLRDLKADVYRPLVNGKPLIGRPAVVMAFGGAFHRGSKGTARFEEDGASDSSMGDYCRTFAAAGYVCLSIEYRLVPEDPALPPDLDPAALLPKAMLKDPVMTARVDVVRGRMELPLLDERSREQLWNTVFAAAEDLASAVEFVRASAAQLGVDPDRLAIGGFSAGGLAAVNAAYGMGAPVRAVISLSGGMGGFDLRKTVKAGMPPGLFVVGQGDLEGVQIGTRALLGILSASGVEAEGAWMPGFGHFYPMGATSLGSDMTKLTLRSRALRFLEKRL
ncbi:MAG: alpha/beta hydrolase [Lysobacterales bacterium]|nr:MAG: alpha/beta hydrolase [Xanthomonadales bacterium]